MRIRSENKPVIEEKSTMLPENLLKGEMCFFTMAYGPYGLINNTDTYESQSSK